METTIMESTPKNGVRYRLVERIISFDIEKIIGDRTYLIARFVISEHSPKGFSQEHAEEYYGKVVHQI